MPPPQLRSTQRRKMDAKTESQISHRGKFAARAMTLDPASRQDARFGVESWDFLRGKIPKNCGKRNRRNRKNGGRKKIALQAIVDSQNLKPTEIIKDFGEDRVYRKPMVRQENQIAAVNQTAFEEKKFRAQMPAFCILLKLLIGKKTGIEKSLETTRYSLHLLFACQLLRLSCVQIAGKLTLLSENRRSMATKNGAVPKIVVWTTKNVRAFSCKICTAQRLTKKKFA